MPPASWAQRLLCCFDRHRVNRRKVRWDEVRFTSVCIACGRPVARARPGVWTLLAAPDWSMAGAQPQFMRQVEHENGVAAASLLRMQTAIPADTQESADRGARPIMAKTLRAKTGRRSRPLTEPIARTRWTPITVPPACLRG